MFYPAELAIDRAKDVRFAAEYHQMKPFKYDASTLLSTRQASGLSAAETHSSRQDV